MIIDVNTYIGHWPFRKVGYDTADKVLNLMNDNDIDIACVSNLNALFYRDVMEGNIELKEQIEPYKNRFISFAIINPAYPGWKKDFDTCVEVLGMKAIELYPCYHKYKLTDKDSVELLNMAADKDIPVHIPCAIENLRQRHWLDVTVDLSLDEVKQVLSLCPKTDFIITNGPSVEIFNHLLPESTNRTGKVYYDISRLGILKVGSDSSLIDKAGVSNIVFGSAMPMQYIETQFVKLRYSNLKDEDIDRILYKNLKELLKI